METSGVRHRSCCWTLLGSAGAVHGVGKAPGVCSDSALIQVKPNPPTSFGEGQGVLMPQTRGKNEPNPKTSIPIHP